MPIEECNGNWNHMYEFKLCGNWYPCHVIKENDTVIRSDDRVWIFTRNGSITTEQNENVRKMSDLFLIKRIFWKTLNIQINMLNIDIVTNGSTLLNHIIRRMVAYH